MAYSNTVWALLMCGLVECNDESEVLDSIKALHRQLTEIIFGALCDLSKSASCIDALCERKYYLQWCVPEAEFLNRMHKVHGRYKKTGIHPLDEVWI